VEFDNRISLFLLIYTQQWGKLGQIRTRKEKLKTVEFDNRISLFLLIYTQQWGKLGQIRTPKEKLKNSGTL